MNLAFKFPLIFWNWRLITDSGGAEDPDDQAAAEEIVDIYEPEDFPEEYEYIDAPDKKTKIKKKKRQNNRL